MKIKAKRVLSMGVSLVMALGMCSFAVHAEEGNVAEVNGTEYATLTAAIDAAQVNDTITLLDDVDATGYAKVGTYYNFTINKSITLDGDGHSIKVNSRGVAINQGGGTKVNVTLKDITINNAASGGRALSTRGNIGTVTLDNVKLNCTGGGNTQGFTVGGNQSSAQTINVINGSEIKVGNAGYCVITFNPVNMSVDGSTLNGWASIYAKGQDNSAGSDGSVFTVTNSTLNSDNNHSGTSNAFSLIKVEDDNVTINLNEGNTVTINGQANYQSIVATESLGYDKNKNGQIDNCVVNITGGDITMTNDAPFSLVDGSDTTTLNISGGTFTLPENQTIENQNGIVNITGGTFNKDVSEYVATNHEAVNTAASVYKVGEVVTNSLIPVSTTDDEATYTASRKVVDNNNIPLTETNTTVNVQADDRGVADVKIGDFDVESIVNEAVAVGGNSDTLTVEIQIYGDSIPAVNGSGNSATYTYEVHPIAYVYDDSYAVDEKIDLENDALANGASFDITLKVPDELTGDTVKVTHISDGYQNEEYICNVSTDGVDRTVKVEGVTHFSQFVLSSTGSTVKDVEHVGFDSYFDGEFWNLRVIGKLNNTENVDAYGAWFIPENIADTYDYAEKEYTNTDTLTSGNTFVADLMNIPQQAGDVSITAMVFVVYSGDNVAITDTATTTPLAVKNSTSIPIE